VGWDYTTLTADNVQQLVRDHFHRALSIYVEFISVHHAEFPVNISSQDLKVLKKIFKGPAQVLYGNRYKTDPATPFTTSGPDPVSPISPTGSEMAILTASSSINDHVQYWSVIPERFSATAFDHAEESIKYLILTNTWPKFVWSGGIFAHLSAAE
jgi:hypothetical protein